MTKKLSTSSRTSNGIADGSAEGDTLAAGKASLSGVESSRNFRVPQAGRPLIAISAGTVLVAIVLGAIIGVIWGVVRPGQNVQFIAPDQFGIIADSLDAPFMALVWFSGLTLVLGVAVAIIAFIRGRNYRTVAIQLWVAVAALIGAMVAFLVGQVVAGFRQPDFSNLENGATLTVIPAFNSHVALLVAPLSAMIAYWIGLLFTEENISVDNDHHQTLVSDNRPENGKGDDSEVAPATNK